jgi:putative phosphoesterase
VGDISTRAVLDELRAIGPPVDAVYGNADDAELRATLPERLVVEVEGVRIGLVHIPGPRAGREERLAARFPGCDAIVYGHTHVPQVELVDGVWILNPGSPTERRRSPARSMLVLDIDGQTLAAGLVTLT